jgi:hypothetical protein
VPSNRRPAPWCREEKFYEREDVLGRDVKSVFPTESRKAVLDSDAVKAVLGDNRKFISETEVCPATDFCAVSDLT